MSLPDPTPVEEESVVLRRILGAVETALGSLPAPSPSEDKGVVARRILSALVSQSQSGGGGSYYVVPSGEVGEFSTAASGKYAVDTTPSSGYAYLPYAPSAGDWVAFVPVNNSWNTHSFTIDGNGKPLETTASTIVLTSAEGTYLFVFIDDTRGWEIYTSGAKPHNISIPTISGHAVGRAATSTNGTWTGSPTLFAYQWQISDDGSTGWADIGGATSNIYTPVSGAETKFVRIGAAATNANGTSAFVYSAASAAIIVPTFPAGATAYWSLNGNGNDLTGNGHTLTNNNGVGFVSGLLGQVAQFVDGSTFTVPKAGIISAATDMSFNGWFNPDSLPQGDGNNCFLFGLDGEDGNTLIPFIISGTTLMSADRGAGDSDYTIVSGGTVTASAWNMLTVTINNSTKEIKIYINATQVASGTFTGDIVANGDNFTLGNFLYHTPTYSGLAGEWGVWGNRVLSDSEITTLYDGGTPPPYA